MWNRIRRFIGARAWKRRRVEPQPLRAPTTDPNELGLAGVHSPLVCADQSACPMHKPSAHSMRDWTVIWRGDRGILERLCPEHGTGHPDPDQVPFWRETNQEYRGTHGCCGCCRPAEASAQRLLATVIAEGWPLGRTGLTQIDFDIARAILADSRVKVTATESEEHDDA